MLHTDAQPTTIINFRFIPASRIKIEKAGMLAPPGGFEPPTFRLGGERYYPAELRRHIQFTENTVGMPIPNDLQKVHQKVPNRVPNSWRRNCKLAITPFFSRFRSLSSGTRGIEQHLRRRTLYPAELSGPIQFCSHNLSPFTERRVLFRDLRRQTLYPAELQVHKTA